MAYVWDCFDRLTGTRSIQVIAGPMGAIPSPAPLTFLEIDAFNRLMAADLSLWEVEVIRRLDQQFIRIATGQPDPDQPKPGVGAMLKARAREPKKA